MDLRVDSVRPTIITFLPCLMRYSEKARPRPPPPPVTMAQLKVSDDDMVFVVVVVVEAETEFEVIGRKICMVEGDFLGNVCR